MLFRVPLSVCVSIAALCSAHGARADTAAVDTRVRELLAQMTLEEKVGQLVQYSSRQDMTGPASQAAITPEIRAGGVGSLLNIIGAENTRKWQKLAVESSRLRIPLLFGLDVIHGYRTVFPVPLGSAASWDLERIERAERIAATETAAGGIHWTFAPMVDIARDPRWGRISEGAGEDPYLGSAIARARVRGFQGGDLAALDTILACAKHFAAYGAAQAGRDYFTTDVPERTLRDVYLPPFHAAVDEGVATLMAAFNDLNGTPCSTNAFLLNQVLRREWGFKGFVVSDWSSIDEVLRHGTATDLRDAGRQAFLAGLDMDMESMSYGPHLAELVRSGAVPESRLDAAAGAILAAKIRLGLFEDPYRYSDATREKNTILRPEFLEAARDLARRSCVLLKNERETLPLKTSGVTVALVGPLADSPFHQLGAWHGPGREEDSVTVRAALAEVFPGERLRYARGCEVRGSDTSGFADARAAAEKADVIVAALGEDADQSGEANSRASLDLSGPQAALLKELRATGKPVVLLLMTGRPLTIETVEPLADAILLAWHPGTMGGPAVTDVLTGAYNPSGHLPVTWPRSVGQIPIFYAHKNSGRPVGRTSDDRYFSHYIDSPNTPLYPFGFGLSYTTFAYDGLRVSAPKLAGDGQPLTVTVNVRNTGKRAGEEVVQLYVRDRVGSVTRPVRELKGFRKIELAAGEARNVEFRLTPADLAFWRADMTFGPEAGEFDVFVGGDSTATLSASFALEL
ncbi:MAG TPA: glycoside hydrolase family 3 N-terminal domain-containing protein [Opitutaceae bacterium]